MPPDDNTSPADPGLPSAVQAALGPLLSTAPSSAAAAVGKDDASKAAQDVFSASLQNIAATAGQISQAYKQGQAAAGVAQAASGQSSVAAQTQSQATLDAGKANATIAYNKAMAAAQTAMDTKSQIASLNMGANDPQMVAEVARLHDASALYQKFEDQKEAIANGPGFFQNPIQFIADRVVNLPSIEDRQEIAAGNVKGLTTDIAAKTQTILNLNSINLANRSADTTEQAAQIMKAGLASAIAQSQDPIIKDAQIKISAADAISAAAESASRAAGTSIEAASSSAHIGFEREQAGYWVAAKQAAIQDMNAKTDNFIIQTQQRLGNTEAIKALNDNASFAFKALGAKIPNGFDVTRITDKPQFEAIRAIGQNLQNGGMLADNPFDAVELLRKSGIPTSNLPDGQKLLIDHIEHMQVQAYQDLSNPSRNADGTPGKVLTGENFYSAAKLMVNERLRAQANDPANSPLVFKPENLNTIIGKDWGKNNPIIQTLRPMTMDGAGNEIQNVPLNFNQVIGQTNQLIAGKKISEAQGAGYIKEIFARLLDDNNKGLGFGRFAIPADPEKYNVSLKFGSQLMAGNMLNTADIYKAMRLERAVAATSQAGKEMRDNLFITNPIATAGSIP